MAKRTDRKEVTRVSGVDASFLLKHQQEDTSLQGMEEFVILPFLKIVQDQTKDQELKQRVGAGGVAMSPGKLVVYESGGDPFLFVPQFFHNEFLKCADIKDSESPFIVARTYDPSHELAKKARDPDLRTEVYPGDEDKKPANQKNYRYVETLNFSGVVYGDHPLSGQRAAMVFSKAEFSTGRRFISGIKMRREIIEDPDSGENIAIKVPLWSQVWEMSTSLRPPRNGGQWYGFDFAPADPPVIDPADEEEFKASYEELKAAHEDNRLRVDHEEDESVEDNEFS